MISVESYKAAPCRALSIPYWKAKNIKIPFNMKIVHNSEFDNSILCDYEDKKFFRLMHSFENIPSYDSAEISFNIIKADQIKALCKMINKSYTHLKIKVTEKDVKGWKESECYCPELWIGAYLKGKLVGSIVCDFDKEIGEAVIEWLQVLPQYRNRGIAAALCCTALNKMSTFAAFATVSGECDNVTNPEKIYRKCGFTGDDVWHILTKR